MIMLDVLMLRYVNDMALCTHQDRSIYMVTNIHKIALNGPRASACS